MSTQELPTKEKKLSLCQWPTTKYSFKDGHNIHENVSKVSSQQLVLIMAVEWLIGLKPKEKKEPTM